MASDPFEEFEFRPLTEGLGFHRKADKKNAQASSLSSANLSVEHQVSGLSSPQGSANASTISLAAPSNPNLKSAAFTLKEPLFNQHDSLPEIEMPLQAPRLRPPAETAKRPASNESDTVDEILKTLKQKRKIEFKDAQVAAALPATQFKLTTPDLSSYILDGMLVTAATLACLIIILMITKADLFAVITQTQDLILGVCLYSLFASVAWIYLVMNRVFLGFTPGEWVFDHRVGLPQQQNSADYSLRVVARATLITLTGLILFPLATLVSRRDWAGEITGASLFKKA